MNLKRPRLLGGGATLGAELELGSSPGTGTRVVVRLPLGLGTEERYAGSAGR